MNIHFAILEFRLRGSMIVLGFPGGSAGKESACSAGDTGYGGSILGQKNPLEKGKATTAVFLPGELHGQRNLVSYSPWRLKELT